MRSPYGSNFDGSAWPWSTTSAFDDWYCLIDARGSYVSDACVEGNGEEMLDIAKALRARKDEHFKRCAVRFKEDEIILWSPRNCCGGAAKIPASLADELAGIIECAVAAGTAES